MNEIGWVNTPRLARSGTATPSSSSVVCPSSGARTGVAGEMIVAADHFDLQARLGMVLGMLGSRIGAEIEKQFDELLGAATKASSKKPERKSPAKKSVAPKKH